MARSLSYSIIALLAVPLMAQAIDESKPRYSFKIAATPATNTGRQENNAAVSVGFEYSRPLGKGEVFAVLEWRDFMSHTYLDESIYSPYTDKDKVITLGEKTGYTPSGDRGYITRYARYSTNPDLWPYEGSRGMIASDLRFDSIDTRRAVLEGVTLKLAYRYRLDALPVVGRLGLQGGLILNNLKASEYSNGSVHVLDYRAVIGQNSLAASEINAPLPASAGRLYSEYWMEQPNETKLMPGAFVGVRKLYTDTVFFEFNLAMLGHTDLKYVPFAYTGEAPRVVSSSKTKTVMEFVAGMRF
jgi:hypothetical protein